MNARAMRSREVAMPRTTLLLTVIITMVICGSPSMAQPTEQGPPAAEPEVDSTIAGAAAELPPTTLSPPTWLASNRNLDFRLRPNAGIRLQPLLSSQPPMSEGQSLLKPWSIRTSLATLAVAHENESAKFQEYRDVRDGAVAGLELHVPVGKENLNLVGRHLGLEDQDFIVDVGRPGHYVVALGYNQTPHNYAFDVRSIFAGLGTTQLTVADRVQSDLQSSATTQEAAEKIRSYVDSSAQNVNISLRRQKVGVDFALTSTYPFTLRLSASNEARDGVKPSSGAFGLGNFEELPWPVRDDTRDLRLSFEYARPESRLFASAAYRIAALDNHARTLLWDNPYRITDSSTGSLAATFAAGPTTGLIQLPPSNDYQEATLSLVLTRLPRHTSVSTLLSAGFLRQNESLLPFSTNTAARLPGPNREQFAATDPAALPRRTAETEMDTVTAQLRLTSQPLSKVHVVAQYRYFDLENNQTPFVIPAFIRADADIRNPATTGGTFAAVIADYNRHTANAEASLDVLADTRFSLGYTYERMNRDFREVAAMTDHRVKASVSTRFPWLDLKASYERSDRDTSDYIFNQYNVAQGNPNESPVLPLLRKFDEAARDRDEVQLIGTSQLTQTLSLSAMVLYARDDYSDSLFGLLEDDHRAYSLDLSYSATDLLSIYTSYTIEQYSTFQRARQWSPAGPSNPYTRETGFDSNSNWEARPDDAIYTASIGLEGDLLEQRLRYSIAYVYSKSDGRIRFASPVGVAANDANAFEPAPFNQVDDVKFHTFNPELEYRVAERLSVAAGYQLEKFSIDDTNYRGFTFTPRNLQGGINAGLLMGAYLFPRYNVNVVYARLKARL